MKLDIWKPILNRYKNTQFEQQYERLAWTDIWTINLNRNMNNRFEEIYEQSI